MTKSEGEDDLQNASTRNFRYIRSYRRWPAYEDAEDKSCDRQ